MTAAAALMTLKPAGQDEASLKDRNKRMIKKHVVGFVAGGCVHGVLFFLRGFLAAAGACVRQE